MAGAPGDAGPPGDVGLTPGVEADGVFESVTVPDVGVVCVSGVFDSLPPPHASAVETNALRTR